MLEVHVLASGSDGNCTVIEHDDDLVMVDAGVNCKTICKLMEVEGLDPGRVRAMLLTHEHIDHVAGVRVFNKKFDVPVYSTVGTFENFDSGDSRFVPVVLGSVFDVCGVSVTSLPTSHDAAEPNAYSLAVDGKRVSIITDTGVMTPACEAALRDSDLAILEANYDEEMLSANRKYPVYVKKRIASDRGHLCNIDTGKWIAKTASDKKREIFLAHLSRNNNTVDIAKDTVSSLTHIPRFRLDCLDPEVKNDTRPIRFRSSGRLIGSSIVWIPGRTRWQAIRRRLSAGGWRTSPSSDGISLRSRP